MLHTHTVEERMRFLMRARSVVRTSKKKYSTKRKRVSDQFFSGQWKKKMSEMTEMAAFVSQVQIICDILSKKIINKNKILTELRIETRKLI